MQFTFFQQLMLPQYLCAGVETLLNKLIQQTAYCAPYLRKLNNKVLAVKLQKIDLPIYFFFSSQRIELLSRYEGETDCAVDIAPSLLFH
ncbi:hypothetical protein AAUPMC_17460, partial [Pasteurella multocida subsp. multocida str. Anand1_cattle]